MAPANKGALLNIRYYYYHYYYSLLSHGFLTTITKPTTVGISSATLIDHIYTNNIASNTEPGIINTDIADHFLHIYNLKSK